MSDKSHVFFSAFLTLFDSAAIWRHWKKGIKTLRYSLNEKKLNENTYALGPNAEKDFDVERDEKVTRVWSLATLPNGSSLSRKRPTHKPICVITMLAFDSKFVFISFCIRCYKGRVSNLRLRTSKSGNSKRFSLGRIRICFLIYP